MFFGREKRLDVDSYALDKNEKMWLSDFLRSRLKANVVLSRGKVSVESEELSFVGLKRLVNKFVYHRNLNRKYWIALNGNVVEIKVFDKIRKQPKHRKEGTPPSNLTSGW